MSSFGNKRKYKYADKEEFYEEKTKIKYSVTVWRKCKKADFFREVEKANICKGKDEKYEIEEFGRKVDKGKYL